MRIRCAFVLCVLLIFLPALAAGTDVVGKSRIDLSLRNEIENAIGKGLAWLASRQNPEGWWSSQEYPAVSALVLTSFQGDPSGFYKKKYEKNSMLGYDYLLKNVKSDGGIYGKDLANYNTAVSVMALATANRPEYESVIKKARNFLIGLQDDQGEKGMGDSPLDGGIGYGDDYKHSDLSNTTYALEAIHYTRYLSSDVTKGPETKDLNWEAAIRFVSRCQNLPGYNDQKWASDDPENRGGFVYFPGNSKAGEMKLKDGRVALRSYGSMSYDGLLSYIYARLDRNDPRVKAVYDWLERNYTLEENPGMGKQGLFYYYHTMAKGLSAYGADAITVKSGKEVNWRRDLAKRLLNMQNAAGFWVNENGRWWEKDPVLTTSYAVLSLEILWRGL